MNAPEHTKELPTHSLVIGARNRWYYVIEMPLTPDGDGPATIGDDASQMTYEVWDQVCDTYGSYAYLADAIDMAERLNVEMGVANAG